MDAKERLRLYLEQRRDAGESELVLDSLSVEEVMRMLGAGGGARQGGGEAASTSRAPRPAGDAERVVPRPAVADDQGEWGRSGTPPDDWRAALRALDPRPAAEREGSSPQRPAGARSDAERAPTPAPSPRAERPAEVELAGAGRADDRPADSERTPAGANEGAGEATRTESERAPGRPSPGTAAAGDSSHATMPLAQVPTGLVVGSPAHELFGGAPSAYATLDDVAAATRSCQLCALHRTAKQAVPGHGNPHAELVCVGEAPGANEDEQGLPFVGQAGQLLTKILAAIDLARDDVFICNVLKHRPPGNRNPLPDEVAACSPYLVRQIELLQPKVLVALGTFAAQTLLQTREPIGRLRGKIHRYYGVPLIVTYHPAALLRNPSWKRPTWEDVQLARRLLDRARGA